MRRLALVLVALAINACSSGAPSEGENIDPNAPEAYEIFPSTVYTGFDGATRYAAPVVLLGYKQNVTWVADDPSVVTLEIQEDTRLVTLVGAKAGKTTLRATAQGGQKFEIPVVVKGYRKEAREQGENLYQRAGRNCIRCHGRTDGPDHTPTQIQRHDDPILLGTIATGVMPASDQVIGDFHRFDLNDAEKEAIVAYIRSLTPRGWPSPKRDE
jgi:mono/diheme cytochrome c family protein